MTLDHREYRLVIRGGRRLRVGRAEAGLIQEWAEAGIVALDVEQIEPHPLPVEAAGSFEPFVQIAKGALGDPIRGVRIPPAALDADTWNLPDWPFILASLDMMR